MLNQIKALLSDAQLRQQIEKVHNLAEVIALMKTAGIKKGYQFSNASLSKFIESQLEPLGEAELLAVAGEVSPEATTHPKCETNFLY